MKRPAACWSRRVAHLWAATNSGLSPKGVGGDVAAVLCLIPVAALVSPAAPAHRKFLAERAEAALVVARVVRRRDVAEAGGADSAEAPRSLAGQMAVFSEAP